LNKWITEDIIKVNVFIRKYSAPIKGSINDITGWYTYDLIEKKITDIEYKVKYVTEG
jgi:hypothetical protein